jgi:hypothetical protein
MGSARGLKTRVLWRSGKRRAETSCCLGVGVRAGTLSWAPGLREWERRAFIGRAEREVRPFYLKIFALVKACF